MPHNVRIQYCVQYITRFTIIVIIIIVIMSRL